MPVNSYFDYPLSWQPDKEKLKRPIYLSLATSLEEDIKKGILAPGIMLPSQRDLADFLDISFTTVTRTYKLCESKGIIHGEVGKGTFVSRNANIELTISKNEVSTNLIDLGFVSSLDQVNKYVIETIKKTVQVKYLEELLNYDHPSGLLHHKKLGVNWLKRFGIEVDFSNLAIVSGAQNALAVILLSVFSYGDTIIVDEFTYSNFINLCRLHGINLVAVKNDQYGMLPEELEKTLKNTTAKGIFLMPSCSNPTGVYMPNKRKMKLVSILKKNNLLIIEDDVQAFLIKDQFESNYQTFYSLLPEQTFYISGLSKPLYSGLRVAFLAFPSSFKEKIEEGIFNINVKTSSFDVEIANQLIQSGVVDDIVAKKRDILSSYHKIYDRIFPDFIEENYYPISFHRWLPVSNNISNDFEKMALEYGIRVFHSNRFFVGSTSSKNYLRVSLSTVRSEKELVSGLKLLRELLRKA